MRTDYIIYHELSIFFIRININPLSNTLAFGQMKKRLIPSSVKRIIHRSLEVPIRIKNSELAQSIWMSDNQKRILALKNIHFGRRAFIIGNGPSLNRMDLSLLKNEITFGSNAFFLAKSRLGFLPTYYNIEDPLPAEDNADTLNALSDTTKIYAHDLKYCLHPSYNTIYVYFDRYYSKDSSPNFPRFSNNALKVVYWGGTVVYMSLQLAFYLGIREAYIIGVDLTYDVPQSTGSDAIITSESPDKNHFHPDYFGPGKRWHHPQVERMQRSIERAAEFFKQNGGGLYNATVGGNLNVLKRVNYDNLF